MDKARSLLGGKTVHPSDKVFLTGYSEGGYATMAGARALYGVAVPVAGTVPCDGPYDLSGVMLPDMISGKEVKVPAYLPYTASGFKAAYPDKIDVNALLQSEWANLITPGNPDNPFDGDHTNAYVSTKVPADTIPLDMIKPTALGIGGVLVAGGSTYNLLADNNGWVGWFPTAPVVLIHCPTDDVVPYQNAVNAQAAFKAMGVPDGVVSIQAVPPLPFLSTLAGSVHVAAYPTATLAAFIAIQTINGGH